jgi:tetratricopeptide (TPR) repeat protein
MAKQRHHRQLGAYDRWLFGQSKLQAWDPVAFQEATEIFERIIAESPDFSPAYSTLAQLQNTVHFVHPGVFREARRTTQALAYARQATRLDPIDSRGQLALGWAHALAGQHDLAETHHALAQELNENDAWTATSVALGFAMRGQHDLARQAARRAIAVALSPATHHWAYHVHIRFLIGDYEGSLEAAASSNEVIPTAQAWKVAALGHLGRREEARAEAERYVERIRSKWFGSEPATDRNVARWTLHSYPIKRAADWERFRDGLALAGMPVSELVHGAW